MWIEVTSQQGFKIMINLDRVDHFWKRNEQCTISLAGTENGTIEIIESYEWVRQFTRQAAILRDV